MVVVVVVVVVVFWTRGEGGRGNYSAGFKHGQEKSQLEVGLRQISRGNLIVKCIVYLKT